MSNNRRSSEEKANQVLQKLREARQHWGKYRRGLLDYTPQKGDVHVCTYAKSGTTLLQYMVYQLIVASGGASPLDPGGENFEELGEVVPWVEYTTLTGVSSFDTNPRVFKSHMAAEYFDLDDKKLRYIYCYRNGLEIPGSMLDMIVPWMLTDMKIFVDDKTEIFDRYVRESFLAVDESPGNGCADNSISESNHIATWFRHVEGWTSQKRENVLVLQFEIIINDLMGTAKRLSEFLGLMVSEQGLKNVVERCDRERMAGDVRFRETLVTKGLGWDPSGGVKARMPGTDGFRAEKLNKEDRKVYDRMLKCVFGANCYEEMVRRIEQWQQQTSL